MILTLILVRRIIFYQRSFFLEYNKLNEEPVQGPTGITKIVVKRYVKLPIENGTLIEPYYSLIFSANILSVAPLSDPYEVVSQN